MRRLRKIQKFLFQGKTVFILLLAFLLLTVKVLILPQNARAARNLKLAQGIRNAKVLNVNVDKSNMKPCIGSRCLSELKDDDDSNNDQRLIFKHNKLAVDDNVIADHDINLPRCSNQPPGLKGQQVVNISSTIPDLKVIEKLNPFLTAGGHYKPYNCVSRWKVAIIIPFRRREDHLPYFLQHMHPILQRQQIEYQIYIINQFGDDPFNRAKLLNVGFTESIKDHAFDCFVFHDVDLLLENDHALYHCPNQPRHLSAAMSNLRYKLPYPAFTGGASQLTKEQFLAVNGYSNLYWGWGGEDDDLSERIVRAKLKLTRYPSEIGRYWMFTHKRDKGNEVNKRRYKQLKKAKRNMKKDGLNTLKYKIIAREDNPLYTNVTVDLLAAETRGRKQNSFAGIAQQILELKMAMPK